MDTNTISEDLKQKARACESAQELSDLATEDGLELSDDVLDGIAGGGSCPNNCTAFRCTGVVYRV